MFLRNVRTSFHHFAMIRKWAVTPSVAPSSLFLSSCSWMVYKLTKSRSVIALGPLIVRPPSFYIVVWDYGHFDLLCCLTCHCIVQQIDTCYTWYKHNICCTVVTLCLICFISFGATSWTPVGFFWNFFTVCTLACNNKTLFYVALQYFSMWRRMHRCVR